MAGALVAVGLGVAVGTGVGSNGLPNIAGAYFKVPTIGGELLYATFPVICDDASRTAADMVAQPMRVKAITTESRLKVTSCLPGSFARIDEPNCFIKAYYSVVYMFEMLDLRFPL